MKLCKTCNTTKPLAEFGTKKHTCKSGKVSFYTKHKCKECVRTESKNWYKDNKDIKRAWYDKTKHLKKDYDLKRNYGIDTEQYNQLLKIQEHSCLVCGTHQDALPRALCVDHDHDTGKVRGLLCDACNRGIGLLKDNQVILNRAIRYLKGTL